MSTTTSRRTVSRLLAFLAMSALFVVALFAVATRVGIVKMSAVETGSMDCSSADAGRLCANPGDLVITRRVQASNLTPGDVVNVPLPGRADGSVVTHRIREIEHHGDSAVITLRGDANSHDDAVTYTVSEPQRAVAVIPHVGTQVRFWLSAPGIYYLLAMGLLLLVAYLAWPTREPSVSAPESAAHLISETAA